MPQVICEYCNKKFEKAMKRINETIKNNGRHTCSRKCSSMLINQTKRKPPTTRSAKQVRKDKRMNPEKNKARELVRRAVRCGKINKPDCCEYCGYSGKIEAHHPDHYRPYFIMWLCRKRCHPFADQHKVDLGAKDYSDYIC